MSKIVVIDRPEYSRVELDTFDPVILATDAQQIISAGTVLGKITASGKYTPLTILEDGETSDGSDVPAAVLLDQVIVPASEDLKKVPFVYSVMHACCAISWYGQPVIHQHKLQLL